MPVKGKRKGKAGLRARKGKGLAQLESHLINIKNSYDIDPYKHLGEQTRLSRQQNIGFTSGLIEGYDKGVSDVYKADLPKWMALYQKEGELHTVLSPFKSGKAGLLTELHKKGVLDNPDKVSRVIKDLQLDKDNHTVAIHDEENKWGYQITDQIPNQVYDQETPTITNLLAYSKNRDRPINFPRKLLSVNDLNKTRNNSSYYGFYVR